MADSPAKLTQYEAAMHEAGHAIAALRVGYHVRDMFLASPDDDRPLRGGVWYRPSALVWDGVPGSLDGDPKNRKMAEDDCLVLAARRLRAFGVTQRELDLMYKVNPAKLLGLSPPAESAVARQ